MRIALVLLLLTSAADARQTQPEAAQSALRGYVLGRYASADAELARAATYFDEAHHLDPGRPVLARRAFDLAVAAGDQARATALARQLLAAGNGDADVVLIRMTDAVLKKDWKAVLQAREGLAKAGYAPVVGPIIEAWALYGQGQHDAALAKLDPASFAGFARSYVTEQRAHMLAADRNWSAAAAAYAELRAGGGGNSFLKAGQADAMAMAGDRDGALKLLSGDDPTILAARHKLEGGKRIGAMAPDPRRGIGWMMARLASDLAREKPVPLALLFARAGTFLAPDVPATWLITGDVLARSQQGEAALVAYGRVPADDALYAAARLRRVEVLEGLGREQDAGAALQPSPASATADDWVRLGDWHRRADRYADAISAYARAIERAGPDAGWGLYFLRGSMRERAGDWAGAEADLREALKRSPDEPIVLNYLGYSMLDRGSTIADASAMVERAAQLRPGDGGVIDSLGWSQYRRGRYDAAVASLERATLLEPADPTVAEHLGDAYWRVGRRIEARFRWRAALDLGPTSAQKAGLGAKLDYGLDAAPAMVPAKG